ncbi:MAG TPA: fibronectin type III domain-containing protein [Candidatus Paceibacterota bacterium]|nr:fibronectin type III domain-containing protein [Candidatus Paceibacterota bacterium]
MIRSFALFFVALALVIQYAPELNRARAADAVAPDITNVQVSNVSNDSVTITWETDEEADSTVNYGLQEDYGIVRVPVADKKLHSITIDKLETGRTYYFRVVSSDSEGNQGISANYKVVTEGTAQNGEGQQSSTNTDSNSQSDSQSQSDTTAQSETKTSEEIIEQIKQIQSPETLQEILNETVKAIQGITEDLTIVGPPTVIPETTSAIVRWTTDRPASSEVVFSPSQSFVEGQYQYSQASTGGNTTDHEVRLIGLEPYTEYHFQVKSKDEYGISGVSRDFTFKTKASLPDIRNLRIVKVEENSATLAWDTTVPAKALIDYQDMRTGAQNTIGRPTLASTHQLRIADLTLGTRYVAFVNAENAGGDRVRSQPITFVTVKDEAPPIISNVTNESTLFPGGESRIQTIVEWLTDEPAHCSLTHREGISGGVEPTVIDSKESGYTMDHVEVIVDFAPATVYQFWLDCADESGNAVKSENFVLFTPIQEKNIIDIIIENFESTFGWVKNIGG